ncbi:peptidase M14 [Bacillus sp. IB182487]|uniref:Peptidase M14 n=2 Tax=Metabacillus arenae TaxID=2771434 RepID=A0A926ND05_9BACI|nr:peptidase M14 [Metabacillus arenae]
MKVTLKKDIELKRIAEEYNLAMELLKDLNPQLQNEKAIQGEVIEIPLCFESFSSKFDLSRNMINRMDSFFEENITRLGCPFLDTKKNYDLASLEDDLELLTAAYPFIRQNVIGTSVLGNPIYELVIGHGPKKIHMNGAFHGNEWITTAVMMRWLDDYLFSVVCNGSYGSHFSYELYKDTTLSFVPMVNPDGVNLAIHGAPPDAPFHKKVLEINNGSEDFSEWKANIQGVDLNNQYPAYWEIEKERKIPKKPANRDYPGEAPLTEPEAITMADLVTRYAFDRIVAFHTQGEEIYWGYLNCEPPEAEMIVREFSINSGYKAIRNIDSHAGFRDWFVYKYKKPGYTVELGLGVNPLPIEQFDEIYSKSKGIFWSTLYM